VTDQDDADEQREPIFEPRERALITATASASLVIGLWAGHWLVPAEAFADHITYNSSYSNGLQSHYRPTAKLLPLLSLLIISLGAFYSYHWSTDDAVSKDGDSQ
jgi:hypothetical protein